MSVYVSRVVGALVAGLVAWLGSQGVELGSEAVAGLETFLTGLLTALGFLVYGVVHPWVERTLGKLSGSGE